MFSSTDKVVAFKLDMTNESESVLVVYGDEDYFYQDSFLIY